VREKKASGSAAIDDIASFILDKYSKKESGIVYCFSRKECEQVCLFLHFISFEITYKDFYLKLATDNFFPRCLLDG
jgi:superfamily II DNA helicase RecQ